MKFKMEDYVRITSDFLADPMLQHQTGDVVALPTKEHLDEYLVKLDGGITRNLKGYQAWVPADCLEPAN